MYPNVHYSNIYNSYKRSNLDVLKRWMDKEVVHLYNGILLSHKKEQIWVSCSEVDEPRASYTEWTKSEKEKQVLYINAYIWNLKRNGNNEPSRQQTCGHRGRWVQFSSVAQSCLNLATPWTAAHQASLSIINSQSLLKLMSIEGDDEGGMNWENSIVIYILPSVK